MAGDNIAQSLIDDVSVVLGNAVYSSDFQGETFTAMRHKTAEILGKIDVLASQIDQIERIAERVEKDTKSYTENMGDTPKETTWEVIRGMPIATEATPKNSRITSLKLDGHGVVASVGYEDGSSGAGLSGDLREGLREPLGDLFHQRVSRYCDVARQLRSALEGKEVEDKTIAPVINSDLYDQGKAPNAPLTKSFLQSDKFKGVISDGDFSDVANRLDGARIGDKSYAEMRDAENKEQIVENEKKETKTSGDAGTDTSAAKEAPASKPAAPASGGGATGGGRGDGMSGTIPRNAYTFGGDGSGSRAGARPGGSTGGKPTNPGLKNDKIEGEEVDIVKLIADMVDSNASRTEDASVEDATYSLPEGSYTVVKDSNGDPVGYRVSKELGGGVYLFDSDSGTSTPLAATEDDNVYYDKETGKYYEMSFPDDADTDENYYGEASLNEVESDAEVVEKSDAEESSAQETESATESAPSSEESAEPSEESPAASISTSSEQSESATPASGGSATLSQAATVRSVGEGDPFESAISEGTRA